tara:strand:- start:2590 stop:3933 length:1344 start_codon:yes stop_codon:yes gene_type:complete
MATNAGNIDSTFLSTVSFTNTLEQREILKSILDIYDEEATVLDIMDMTGAAVPSAQTEFFHTTNDFLYATASVKTAVNAGSAGASVSVTFESDEGVTPVEGELCIFNNGVVAYVNSVSDASDPVVVLKPVNASDSIPAQADGDLVSFFSNAYAEGTGVNQMRKSNLVKRSNKLQIFKTKTSVTDIAYGSKVEVEFKGKPYYFLKQQHDAFVKHRMDIAFAMLFGRASSSLTDKDSNAINTTAGLRDTIINSGGITAETGTANQIALADYKTLSRTMDANRCPSEYFMYAGADYDNNFDEDLSAAAPFVSGGIQYNAFGSGNGKAKALELGIDSIKMFGRTFHKKRFSALSHPKVSSTANLTQYADEAYLVPANTIKTDGGGGAQRRMQLRYLEMQDGVNSRFREKILGGLAPTPTSATDTLDIVYTSIEGLQILGSEHFVKHDCKDS